MAHGVICCGAAKWSRLRLFYAHAGISRWQDKSSRWRAYDSEFDGCGSGGERYVRPTLNMRMCAPAT